MSDILKLIYFWRKQLDSLFLYRNTFVLTLNYLSKPLRCKKFDETTVLLLNFCKYFFSLAFRIVDRVKVTKQWTFVNTFFKYYTNHWILWWSNYTSRNVEIFNVNLAALCDMGHQFEFILYSLIWKRKKNRNVYWNLKLIKMKNVKYSVIFQVSPSKFKIIITLRHPFISLQYFCFVSKTKQKIKTHHHFFQSKQQNLLKNFLPFSFSLGP